MEAITQEEVFRAGEWWHMDVRDQAVYNAVQEYLALVRDNRYFATAMLVPMQVAGLKGIILLASTPESTRLCMENVRQHQQQAFILYPHWLAYDLWYFEGLSLGNFKGITDSRHGVQNLMNFGEWLSQYFGRKGIEPGRWRSEYCAIARGFFRESLRTMLRRVFHVHF